MRHLLVLSSVIGTLSLAACGERPAEPAEGTPQGSVQAANFDTDFELRVGQTANVGGQALTIAFRGVHDDSRCPMDVVCVWMGDATVALDVTVGRMAWTPLDVHTHVDPKTTTFRDFTIELVTLLPYPKSDSPINPTSYVATLRVKRRG